MFDKMKSVLSGARKDISQDEPRQPSDIFSQIPGGFGSCGLFPCSETGSYDNTFPDISRIAEAFAEVMPYAIDENGERLKEQPQLIRALYNPNEEMSARDFFETLITMMLVHPLVYILVWHYENGELVAGGPITKDNIAGFTFLEDVTSSTVGGTTTYYAGTDTWTKDDVIVLGLNVNPYSLIKGYSPSMAVKKWATTDDYIAEYQNGVFRNGAVPAGMFVITAPSVESYNEIVDSLQKHHRGAGNANNVMYVHRPTSAVDGKPMSAQVEWVPFSQSNKDMTLDAVFNQANNKIDMSFGVPEEVKGHLSNSTYASAEVADYIFSRRVVYPKLVKIWSKFTHEMNRISKGLGFSITFDYETPVLTDTRKLQAETLQIMLNAGFTVESSVEALQLPKSFLKLEESESNEAEENLEAEDDADEKPSQTIESSKSVKQKAVGLATNEEWTEKADPMLLAQVTDYQKAVIDKAAELIPEKFDGTEESIDDFIAALEAWLKEENKDDTRKLAILLALMSLLNSSGQTAVDRFTSQLEIDGFAFSLSANKFENYKKEIYGLLDKFDEGTITEIRKVVEDATHSIAPDSLDAARQAAVRAALQSVSDLASTKSQRVDRWAISEQHKAENTGVLEAASSVAEKSNTVAYKTWRINPASLDVCQDCIGMDGETVEADKPFSNGQMIPHYHPYCYCTVEFSFRPVVIMYETVKLCCPHCKRYMMNSDGGSMKNVICANSKCKRHYDIEVKNGKAKFTEVKNDNSK